ncbi:S8 family serine peptidase, partial [Sanguibacter sp. 25GB23B1]
MRPVHRTRPARTATVLALSLLAFTLSPVAHAALPADTPDPTSTTEPAAPTESTPLPGEPAPSATLPSDPAPTEPVPSDPAADPAAPANPATPTDPAPVPDPTAPAVVPDAASPDATATPAPDPSSAEPEAQYIVLYTDGTDVDAEADELRADGTVVEQTFTEAPAAVVTLTATEADTLATTAGVEAVEPDSVISALATQPNAPWGLDRIDQRTLPLSRTFSPPSAATGVTVYVLDTGVTSANVEFGGRVTAGWTAIADGRGTQDCNGHGSHIAGTIAGSTYGVAKGATIVPVRVLGCDGKGTLSDLLAGIDWITAQHGPGAPAVANLSLGGVTSPTLDTSLQRMIEDGVTAVVAAGNDSVDACSVSPARVPQAITVAASDSADRQAYFTNIGACVDLYAPGVLIPSAGHLSATATATKSGTSTAAPHASGAAALLLAENPAMTPAQVAATLVGRATPGVVVGATGGTPNRMLYVPPVVNATPIGAIDVARASGPDTIQLRGWALDPDTTDPIDIHVYVGSTVTPVRAE